MAGHIIGVLLAAGRGRRFAAVDGRDKLQVRVDGRAIARRACEALAAGCDGVLAVVRADTDPDLAAQLRDAGARLLVADDADLGLGHSVAAAARALRDAPAAQRPAAVLVMPADLAWIRTDTVATLSEAARAGPPDARAQRIVVPVLRDGRRGHPVGFGATHLDALARLRGDQGARTLLASLPLTPVICDDPGILRDVDTPSDLSPT